MLALVLSALCFGPLAAGAVQTPQFLVLEGLILAATLIWIIRIWIASKPQILWPPVCSAVVGFAIYALICWRTAEIEYVARQEALQALLFCLLFLVVLDNLYRKTFLPLISMILIVLATGLACYAVYQVITHKSNANYLNRGSGTFFSPNHLGGFLEMILPLAFSFTILSRLKAPLKIITGYGALTIMAGIASTGSRGSWFSALAGLAWLFGVLIFHQKYRLPALVIVAGLLVGATVVLPRNAAIKSRASQLFTNGKVDDDMRFALWAPAIQVWKENPWFGVGPAHFDYHFPKYRPESVQLRPRRAHNDYLNTLADYGIIGVLLVALVLAGAIYVWAKTWAVSRGPLHDASLKSSSNALAFFVGGSAGLVAILTHSLLDFNMHIPANAVTAAVLLAVLCSQVRFATERHWIQAGAPLRVFFSACVAAGVGLLAWSGVREAREYKWLQRADRELLYSKEQVADLKQAFGVEPHNPETSERIAESLRMQSSEGGKDYAALAEEAMVWFKKTTLLSPREATSYLGYGWCLDWMQKPQEASVWFSRAEELDPNGYFTTAQIGRHYLEADDYAAAKPWFERSIRLRWQDNPIAINYLRITNARMTEAATNALSLRIP